MPDTEKNGRVHTSNITIAALPETQSVKLIINENDLEWKACRGSGAGGQLRNKVSSAVQLMHLPTGIMIRCEQERSQNQNKNIALDLLKTKLYNNKKQKIENEVANDRKGQVGSGMRSDKRRTVAYQRGEVVDHITGKRWKLKNYLRGDWE